MPTTILYGRTSTAEQTIRHQLTQARAAGFDLTHDNCVFDEGVSGVSTNFADRDGGKLILDTRLGLKRGDTLVVRWVDRLGRNYVDVTDTIRELMRRGVVVRTIINNMTFDGVTTDPMQQAVRDALIAFMAATAQAQAEATKAAQKAGIAHAREAGDKRYLGRKPKYTAETIQRATEALSMGARPADVARDTGLSRQAVYRIKGDPAKAVAAVEAWGA